MMNSQNQHQPTGPQAPAQALTTMRIIWGALLASQAMYLYLGMTALSPELTDGAAAPTLLEGLQDPKGQTVTFVATVILIMSFVFPKTLAKRQGTRQGKAMPIGPLATPVQMRFVQFILGCALNESLALLGLTAGFIILKNSELGSVFIYVAMAAMLVRFPTEESMRDPAAKPPGI